MPLTRTGSSMLIAVFLHGWLPSRAQDVPPLPPMRNEDGSPSLESTMKFIQDKLNWQGAVIYVRTTRNSRTDEESYPKTQSSTLSEVQANPSSCSFVASRLFETSEFRSASKEEFSLKDIDTVEVISVADWNGRMAQRIGQPEVSVEITPSVFYLEIQMW